MKFGLIKYEQSNKNPKYAKKLSIHLPAPLKNFYMENFHPYRFKEISLLGSDGYEITLSATKEQVGLHHEKWAKILKEMGNDFYDKEVAIFVPPLGENLLIGTQRIARGKILASFFTVLAIKKELKRKGKPLKEGQVVIIDGENMLTKLVVDATYQSVNFLCIYTDNEQKWINKSEEIYEECGLSVQIITDWKTSHFREADAFINCGENSENYDYGIKKGAFYFDVAQNDKKFKELQRKRSDLTLCNSFILKKQEDFVSAPVLEAILYSTNTDFLRFCCSLYDKDNQECVAKMLESECITISNFTCLIP